jgi:gas vesicle protein
MKKLNKRFPDVLKGVIAYLNEQKFKEKVQDWSKVRKWMKANGLSFEDLDEEKEYHQLVSKMSLKTNKSIIKNNE